jgi:hypothetical protein
VTTGGDSATVDITDDIPCERCGYDLRGLPHDGQCPECGLYTRFSIETWEEHRAKADISISDPRWIREVREGLFVSLLSFVLVLLLAAAPQVTGGWAVERKSHQREAMLGVAATAFVLSCAAAWKLSARDARAAVESRRSLRLSLRAAAAVYMTLPFVVGLMPDESTPWLWLPVILLCVASGAVATAGWFLTAAALSVRCGSSSIAVVARLLAGAGALMWTALLLLPELDAPVDSLSSMYRTPLIQFGPSRTLYDLLNAVLQGYWHPLLLAAAAMPIASAIVNIWMLALLRRAYRPAARRHR